MSYYNDIVDHTQL